MKSISKTLVGSVAVGAMALASATPAIAGDRHRDRGPSTEEVVVGALILGGIAAIAASSGNNDDRYDRRNRRHNDRYDDRYDRRSDRRDNRRGNADRAVERCIRAAERQAQRYTGSRARVTEIRDVDRERGGFEVKGRIAVRDGYNGRSRNSRNNGWDEGRFTCDFRRGQVVDIDYRGIRNL